MSQIDISLKMRGGFKNLGTAKAHREIVKKAIGLREGAIATADQMMKQDSVDLDSSAGVSSLENGDLDPAKGSVIMLGENEDGSVSGGALKFNPDTGEARYLEAETPEGKLTRSGAENADNNHSPTFKWETGEGAEASTTYFKFDDQRGVLSVLDDKNQIPAFFGDIGAKEVKELVGSTFQGGIPILLI